jgi:hypothetical protein
MQRAWLTKVQKCPSLSQRRIPLLRKSRVNLRISDNQDQMYIYLSNTGPLNNIYSVFYSKCHCVVFIYLVSGQCVTEKPSQLGEVVLLCKIKSFLVVVLRQHSARSISCVAVHVEMADSLTLHFEVSCYSIF